ncbi:MAG: carboxymuconolactone decarboxylase family protein [Hyphomicrobiales bacterium]|nr:carboxymuconolactone decarboxylase family protein [Hyphomicrobiales bacterium]
MTFPLHDENNAPEASRVALENTKRLFGMIPNLERVMASAPPLLRSYSAAWGLFDETTFTPSERQVVYLTANYENECEYCVPWHSLLAEKAGLQPEHIKALREGAALSDPKLEALRGFAKALIANRGKVSPAEISAFFKAGYNQTHALEVVLGLAIKTMSNYTTSIAATPLDKPVQHLSWRKPKIQLRGEE